MAIITVPLMHQLFTAPTWKERVNASATLIMWFAAGAFIASTVNSYIPQIPDGVTPDILGGLVGMGVGAIFKAV